MTSHEPGANTAAGVSPAFGGEYTRRTNLSLVLSLLHHRGVLSRAELTRATGLNRSTVASLIGQLSDAGLAFESAATASNQIGRPSPNVHPSAGVAAIAVNPEVDAVTVGLVGLGGKVLKRIRHRTEHIPTPRDVTTIVTAIVDDMRLELEGRFRVVGIGIAVPGLTRTDVGVVTNAPRLDWHDEPVAALLSGATGLAAVAANDAALAARAALHFGGGRGFDNLVYLHGGASGIGGGIIGNGILRSGADGYAGQLGHTLVRTNGHACHCGSRGCLETEVTLARLQELVGLPGSDGEEVERAMRAGLSPAVAAEVARQADFLSVTLRNAVNVFNPQAIILGGFLGTLFEFAGDRMRNIIARRALYGPREVVELSRSVLGSDLLMIGAAELAFSPLLADPLGVIDGAVS